MFRSKTTTIGLLAALSLMTTNSSAQQLDARWLPEILDRGLSVVPVGSDGRVSLHMTGGESSTECPSETLRVAPGMCTLRLLPGQISPFLASHPHVSLSWTPALLPRLDQAQRLTGAAAYRQSSGMTGQGVLVGIIDTGLDPRHPDLRNEDGTTRIAWLLDLSRGPSGKYPELEQMYGCNDQSKGGCRVWGADDINAALAPLSPELLPTDPMGHGTHVTSIAAGNGLGSKGRVFSGLAPNATIIGAITARAGTEAVTDEDALLAARFMFEQADRMHQPIVVNASLGRDFGPHDGSSWIETGLAKFVEDDQMGRALVVAAGNSGTVYLTKGLSYGIHTQVRVSPGADFHATTRALAVSGERLSGELFVWVSWQPGDELSIGVEGPNDMYVAPVGRDGMGTFESSELRALVLNAQTDPDDPLTAGSDGALVYVKGNWHRDADIDIVVRGHGTADMWLQGTGDAAPSATGLGQMFINAVKQNTVNLPGNNPHIIAVGATTDRTVWTDSDGERIELDHVGSMDPAVEDGLVYFSGAGPNAAGAVKPDLCAPGFLVAGAVSTGAQPKNNPLSMFSPPSGLCPTKSNCLMLDDQHGLASGTSMAAPMVAGGIALLLQREPTLTQAQILGLLQAGARNPSGPAPHSSQVGAGTLDLPMAAQALLEQRSPSRRPPDSARSWIAISTEYALPRTDWPVCGMLKTRDADGNIADGIEAGDLTLWVAGGVVLEPLTPRTPGLWDFCVAAAPDTGGKRLRIEARYRGKPLGKQVVLAIGADGHLAQTPPSALGGCSIVHDRRDGTPAGHWVFLLGIAALLMRKRSGITSDRG